MAYGEGCLVSCSELQKKGEEVYSKPLQAYGMLWRLKVYPVSSLHIQITALYCRPLNVGSNSSSMGCLSLCQNGHREDTGNYLAVFVELTEGFDRSTRFVLSESESGESTLLQRCPLSLLQLLLLHRDALQLQLSQSP